MKSRTLLLAAIVIAAMFVAPAAAQVKYFHTSLPPGPVTNPVGTELHELYPNYCNWYNLSSWYDNNRDGNLSFCDVIDITNRTTEEVTYWHVENVTVTLNLANEEGEVMYLDYMMGIPIEEMLKHPIGTYWHEIYPVFCNVYELTSWMDNGNNVLDYCDWINITDEGGNVTYWHVEENVTIDIVVRTMCLGECYNSSGCNGTMLGVMPCWQCLGPNAVVPGNSWENFPCPECPCPCAHMCWDYCPDCCDGLDNDGDHLVDCDGGPFGWASRDLQCECCLDHNETAVDPCGQGDAWPCVPELATFALVGVGILGIVGIGLRRRE